MSPTLETLRKSLAESPEFCTQLFARYQALGRPFLLRSELWDEMAELQKEPGVGPPPRAFERLIGSVQEAAVDDGRLLLAVRRRIGRWAYLSIDAQSGEGSEIGVAEYLESKERLVRPDNPADWTLEFVTEPFFREVFAMQEARSIGRGMEFLNRCLSSDLFDRPGRGRSR